jgi:hypothetical protein
MAAARLKVPNGIGPVAFTNHSLTVDMAPQEVSHMDVVARSSAVRSIIVVPVQNRS